MVSAKPLLNHFKSVVIVAFALLITRIHQPVKTFDKCLRRLLAWFKRREREVGVWAKINISCSGPILDKVVQSLDLRLLNSRSLLIGFNHKRVVQEVFHLISRLQ